MLYQKSDVFPNHVSPAVEKMSVYPNFGNVLTRSDLRYFCLFMHKEKIYFQTREIAPCTRNSFPSFVKRAKTLCEWMPDDINFNKVFARWKRPPIDNNRRNADIRAGFKMGNEFLVNGCFTFGQRTVPEGLVHVFQTLDVPMLFYLRRNDKLDRTEDARFPCGTMCRYERRILPANTCSRIPSGVTYFVLTVQKTFFRVDVCEASCPFPFEFHDPVAQKIAKLDCLYDQPAATPYIEDLYREPEKDERVAAQNDGTLTMQDWSLFFQINPLPQELPVLEESRELRAEPLFRESRENVLQENVLREPPEQRAARILEKTVIFVENSNLLEKLRYLKREFKCPPVCEHCSGPFPEASSIQPEPLDLSGNVRESEKRKRGPPPSPIERVEIENRGGTVEIETAEMNLEESNELETSAEINLEDLEFLDGAI